MCAERVRSSVASVRALAVYCARAAGGGVPSFPELGRYFLKHHSTLVDGDRKIRARMKYDTKLRLMILSIIGQSIQNNEGNGTCHIGEASGLTRVT